MDVHVIKLNDLHDTITPILLAFSVSQNPNNMKRESMEGALMIG